MLQTDNLEIPNNAISIGRKERESLFPVHHIPVLNLLHDKRGNVHGEKRCKCKYRA